MNNLETLQKQARDNLANLGTYTQHELEILVINLISTAYLAGKENVVDFIEDIGVNEYRDDEKIGYRVSLKMLEKAKSL